MLRWLMITFTLLALGCSSQEPTETPRAPAPQAAAAPAEPVDNLTLHFRNRTAKFREENAKLPADARNVVFVGDSLTEGFFVEQWLPEWKVLDRGIGGDVIVNDEPGGPQRGLVYRLPESVFDTRPEFVFLLIGSNDMPLMRLTLEELAEHYQVLVDQIREKVPEATLVIQTIPPVGLKHPEHWYANGRIRAFNRFLRSLAAEERLPLLDLWKELADEDGLLPDAWTNDGLHMYRPAYEKWGAAARAVLEDPQAFIPAVTATPEPPKWTAHYLDRVELFRKENAGLADGERTVVFLGDSLTERFDLKKHFPDLDTLNRGIVADGITWLPDGPEDGGVIQRLGPSVLNTHPAVVVILIGSNDIPHTETPLEYFQDGYRRMVRTIRNRQPQAKLILQTLPPTGEKYRKHAIFNPRAQEFNQWLETFAGEEGLPLVDLWGLFANDEGMLPAELTADGLHVNEQGYEKWAAELRGILHNAAQTGSD